MQLNFVIPSGKYLKIDSLENFEYWHGGAVNWPLFSFLMLKDSYDCKLSTDLVDGVINLIHVSYYRELKGYGRKCFCVVFQADYRHSASYDYSVVQNPYDVKRTREIFLPYWTVPNVLKRSEARSKVSNVFFVGRHGGRNLDSSIESIVRDEFPNLKFFYPPKDKWHDLSSADILVGIRDFNKSLHHTKPASKLMLAWEAKIPFIGGTDSAYSDIGDPGIDYLSVSSASDFKKALHDLVTDQSLYDYLVSNGAIKSNIYNNDMKLKIWQDFLDYLIYEVYPFYTRSGNFYLRSVVDKVYGYLR